MESDPGFIAAIEEAKAGFEEGGVPIGACLVSKEGKILGRGHNMRVQKGSAILHVRFCLSRGHIRSDRVLWAEGRDVGTGGHRETPSIGLPRRYHVHHAVSRLSYTICL